MLYCLALLIYVLVFSVILDFFNFLIFGFNVSPENSRPLPRTSLIDTTSFMTGFIILDYLMLELIVEGEKCSCFNFDLFSFFALYLRNKVFGF